MVPLTFDYCVFDVSSFYYHSARSSGKNSRNVENRTTDCRKQDTGFNGNSGQKKPKTHSETTQKRKIILNLLSTCTFHLPTVRHWACVRKQKTKKQNSGCWYLLVRLQNNEDERTAFVTRSVQVPVATLSTPHFTFQVYLLLINLIDKKLHLRWTSSPSILHHTPTFLVPPAVDLCTNSVYRPPSRSHLIHPPRFMGMPGGGGRGTCDCPGGTGGGGGYPAGGRPKPGGGTWPGGMRGGGGG